MISEQKVTCESILALSDTVDTVAEEMDKINERLAITARTLSVQWTGAAANAFQFSLSTWLGDMDDLNAKLEAYAADISAAQTEYAERENGYEQQL
ncbi:hypothetical protein GCM10022198_19720 [Klugiella xanthotipulae]|uniref:WXG100 family type VII secretion target n=1 Tax=Klugiella xanthotipulae TaxID=244735 RepID=A0A543I6Q8_9MICO|nr:WXG100 family type VII secretion target [Klugiella xanthotipulae]TQM66293.1 WXG100 family type VII secretion target [Klugiella xanthotipulae]